MGNNAITCIFALSNACHIGLKLCCHIRRGNVWCKLRERINNCHTKLTWFNRIILEIFTLVERINNGSTRRFCTQTALLHLLNKLALAIASRWLCLLCIKRQRLNRDNLSLANIRNLIVFLKAKGINLSKAWLGQDRSICNKGLTCNIKRNLSATHSSWTHKGCKEPSSNQVIELPSCGLQSIWICCRCWINWWVVGRLLLATSCVKLWLTQEFFTSRSILRNRGQRTNTILQVKRTWIDRVIDTWI